MEKIKKSLLWLVSTNLGRILMGAILAIVGGVLSPYGTIEFLSTDYDFFTYMATTGMVIISAHVVVMIIYAWIINPIRMVINKKNKK